MKTEKGKFLGFTDMCNRCTSLAYEEDTYDEVFEEVRVREKDGLNGLLDELYTTYSE